MTNEFSILIADDSEINLWLLREQLECWATEISLAKDGREAWELLQQQSYALVFLDMNMPYFGGMDLIEKLRASHGCNSQTPAIAVTAHTQEQQRELALAAGFNDYLVKPIRLQHLEQVVTRWRLTSDDNAAYYAEQVLRKTQGNSALSQTLLRKLFAELPDHLAEIEHSVSNNALQQAWDLVHKLQGTLCFYDFANCLAAVDSLEKSLTQNDPEQAHRHFKRLKVKLNWLLDNQTAVLQSLLADDNSQSILHEC